MILDKLKAMVFGKNKSTVEDIQNLMNIPLSTRTFHPDNFELTHPDKSVINYHSITVDMIISLLYKAQETLESDTVSTKMTLKALRDLLVEYDEVIQKYVISHNSKKLNEQCGVKIAKIPHADYLSCCQNRKGILDSILESIDSIIKEPLTKKIHKKKIKLFNSNIYFEIKGVLLEDTYFHVLHYQKFS